MIVIFLLVAAAAALGYGWVEEESTYVVSALCLSVLAALLVLAPHVVPFLARLRGRTGESAVEAVAKSPEPVRTDVSEAPGDDIAWFVPGRTTFHREGWAALGDRPASSAQREQLEVGGMSACRRCHT